MSEPTCTGTLNAVTGGQPGHVHLLMECWKCEHPWWDCTNEENPPCPQCGEPNWAREPFSGDAGT